MNLSRHYSFALWDTQVLEGALAPFGHSVIQAHLYKFSDGTYRAHLEGYPMVRATDGMLIAAPEGTEPWHLGLGSLPAFSELPDSRPARMEVFRQAVRGLASREIAGLAVSRGHSPQEPWFVDKPLDPQVELLVLDSVFWAHLWDELGDIPRPGIPRPEPWAVYRANLLVARCSSSTPQQRDALTYLAALNAINHQEGPRDLLALLAADVYGFHAQLPHKVRAYLDGVLSKLLETCLHAPVAFNRLDLLNCLKAGIDFDAVLA